MASTNRHELTNAAWTEVADGLANVLVQRVSQTGGVRVAVAASEPDADAPAHILSDAGPTISFSGLVGTDKVFARALGLPVSVVVTAGS